MSVIDNKTKKIINKLRDYIKADSEIFIITDIFTIYAFYELLKNFDKISFVKIILTPKKIDGKPTIDLTNILKFKDEITYRNLFLQNEVSHKVFKLINNKIEIRTNNIQEDFNQNVFIIKNKDNHNIAITGSSNFTTTGLGINFTKKHYIITENTDKDSIEAYLQIFNSIWSDKEDSFDIKNKITEYIKLGFKDNSPHEIYFQILHSIFSQDETELNEERIIKTKTGIKNTLIWNKLYKFQKDAVLGAIDKIEKYNGCIIADSVGLGKTFEALAIIKYYELRNDRVLVLVPKRLRENWTIYTINDKRNILSKDKFNFDVLNHSDLNRNYGMSGEINLETINWKNYDLVVIDESHNFRNNNARKGTITRYQRLMNDVIKEGVDTKVLMLSATPVNNRMNDLKNQIAFITKGQDYIYDSYNIPSYENILKNAQRRFNQWLELPDEKRTIDKFVDMTNTDYFRLLDLLTIARSRKHIEKYYNIEEIGVFPERLKPVNIKSDLDIDKEFPPLKEINQIIKKLNLAIYSPLKYLMPDKQEIYAKKYDIEVKQGKVTLRQIDREESLINLMRVNILKRMESSIYSFRTTCEKIYFKLTEMLERINEYHNSDEYLEEIDIMEIDLEDEEIENQVVGGKIKVLINDLDIIKMKQELEQDKEILEKLIFEGKKINPERDAKLQNLKKIIKSKIENPINPGNKKILVFSAFATTVEYLYENLSDWILNDFNLKSALVIGTGANKSNAKIKRKDLHTILTLFSPLSKEKEKTHSEETDTIDIVFATDCISEGQNLQDCDCLINYDIHWNPVRIIQRFGRIDRIGSINSKIQLINFWPNMELDEYINLEARVSGKMVLLDVSATGEENIIKVDEKKLMNDLEYRRKQLEKLQDKVVDLEEMVGGISISDMTFNDFKMDLVDYLKDKNHEIEYPYGIFTITPSNDEIEPGIIFCLENVSKKKNKQINSLHPYYLVYINNNNEIKYSFSNSRKILDLIKKQCLFKKIPDIDLCNKIEKETSNYSEMTKYYELFSSVIKKITGDEEEKGLASIFGEGETLDFTEITQNEKEFEIVAFLIITEES